MFHCHRRNTMQTFLIIICTLATVSRIEALQELVYDPMKQPYLTVEPFTAGTVVKIPGLITALTAYSWKDLDVGIGYPFAISENNNTRVQLQVNTVAGQQNAIFCSVGTSSEFSPEVGTIIFGSRAEGYDWRGPCKPARVPLRGSNASCAVVLTDAGDLQLLDVVANEIIWRSNTDGVGQSSVTVDDNGNLSLVRVGDNRTVWTSARNDSAGSDPECLTFSGSAENLLGGPRVLKFPGGVRCFLLTFFTSAAAFLRTSL